MELRRIFSGRIFSAQGKQWPLLLLPILVCAVILLAPHPSPAADIDVSVEEITVLDGRGRLKTEFLPGEEIQVRVRLRVLRTSGNPFWVRLRIAGDGWHAVRAEEVRLLPGVRVITFGGSAEGLFVSARAAPGKVSLLADAFSAEETVSLLGRRHRYLNVMCPDGVPGAMTARLQVGVSPFDMALTADGRYLYVTSQQDRKVTVIDVEEREVAAEIADPDTIGLPSGVAAWPGRGEMLVADAGLQAIHRIHAETHELLDTIRLNPTGELGVTGPGDLAVNRLGTEAYVTDSRGPRIFIVDLRTGAVRTVTLFTSLIAPPSGLSPIQVLPDPANPRFLYVLCTAFNEVIKVDVSSGRILDFVRLRNLQSPSSLWPVWSMAVNRATRELYVVGNPGGFESTYRSMQSKIYALSMDWLGGPGRRELLLGSSIWDLVVREDGRFVYAIDSYRGEILVIDMDTETEMSRCAIPVEPGGRHLRLDSDRNRLFVGGWLVGFVDIVE